MGMSRSPKARLCFWILRFLVIPWGLDQGLSFAGSCIVSNFPCSPFPQPLYKNMRYGLFLQPNDNDNDQGFVDDGLNQEEVVVDAVSSFCFSS